MTTTTLTEDQRANIIATIVARMVKRGDIFENQMIDLRNELAAADDEHLLEMCEELGIENPGDSTGAGL